jgi:hypothetical protein
VHEFLRLTEPKRDSPAAQAVASAALIHRTKIDLGTGFAKNIFLFGGSILMFRINDLAIFSK